MSQTSTGNDTPHRPPSRVVCDGVRCHIGCRMPSDAREQPNEYVQDLVAYLQTTFVFMMFLPEKDARAVHYLSCKHICTTLMVPVTSSHKGITVAGCSGFANESMPHPRAEGTHLIFD